MLEKLEERFEPSYLQKYKEWERQKAVAELRVKTWETNYKKALSDGKEPPEESPDCQLPPEPHRRQFILNDLTIEAFMRAQTRNPRGFMVFRHELAGWLANMERYSSESERGAWLESYDGGSYAIERVKDGNKTIRVRHMSAPILGGIQPERLHTITSLNAVDDGLQARFMPFWPEDNTFPMAKGLADHDWLLNAFENLAYLTMSTDEQDIPVPSVIKFTGEAFEVFRLWSDDRKSGERHVPARLGAVYGKADGLVARLALVLEHLWWAAVPDFDDDGPPKCVSVDAVEAAIRFREDYVKVMQRRVFTHAIEAPEVTDARLIASWIVDQRKESLNKSEVRREAGIKGLNSRTPAEIVDNAMATLVSMNWVIPAGEETKRRRGRPRADYIVNPRVWERLATT